MPEFYSVIKVAQYLNVKPWELIEQPIYWFEAGLTSMEVDSLLEEHRHKEQHKHRS